MNVLYTLTSYLPAVGGAQIYAHLLAQRIQQTQNLQVACHWDHVRYDWLLGTTLRQPAPRRYVFEGIPVQRLGFSPWEKLQMLPWLPLYYPWMEGALPAIARPIQRHLAPLAETADLIHNVRIGREGLTYASHQVARQRDIPFVLTPVHHPRWVGWRYRAYIKLYQQADAVLVLTPSEKQILIGLGVQPARLHVTGMGPMLAPSAAPEDFRQRHDLTGTVVLFLGQHYDYKGFRQLLAATPQVWTKFPETQFVFVGPPVRQSEKAFAEYSDPRIHRLGAVDLQTKTDALAACDLLCVPSMQESFGGVYTEAWSFAKPVIGGRIPAIADVITEGVDGLLVQQTPEDIAAAILTLLENPTQAAAMGQAGYGKVQTHYTWSQLAEKTLKVYRQVCGGM